jgi:hypothetical protein
LGLAELDPEELAAVVVVTKRAAETTPAPDFVFCGVPRFC